MATKRLITLPAQNGVVPGSAAGTQATLTLPLGYRYHRIDLIYIDGTAAPTDVRNMFGDVNVFRRGIPERTHSALELDHLNQLNGTQYGVQQVGAGVNMRQTLPIFFNEPWRKNPAQADQMAWSVDTNNGFNTGDFQIVITLLAAFPATGSIVALATVDAPIAPAKGTAQSVKKVYRQQLAAAGLSNDFNNFPQKDAYQTMCLKNPSGAGSGYIQYVTVKSGSNIMLDNVHQEDNIGFLTNSGLNPANSQAVGAFGYDIVFDYDDPINSALPAAGAPIWLKPTYSAAASGNVVALIERLGPLD